MQEIYESTRGAPSPADSQRILALRRDAAKMGQDIKLATQGFSNTRKELAHTEKELACTQRKLACTVRELSDTKQDFASTTQKLVGTTQELTGVKLQLASAEQKLADTTRELADVKLQLASASKPIAYSEHEPTSTEWELVTSGTSVLTTHSVSAEGPMEGNSLQQDARSIKDTRGRTWPHVQGCTQHVPFERDFLAPRSSEKLSAYWTEVCAADTEVTPLTKWSFLRQ